MHCCEGRKWEQYCVLVKMFQLSVIELLLLASHFVGLLSSMWQPHFIQKACNLGLWCPAPHSDYYIFCSNLCLPLLPSHSFWYEPWGRPIRKEMSEVHIWQIKPARLYNMNSDCWRPIKVSWECDKYGKYWTRYADFVLMFQATVHYFRLHQEIQYQLSRE